MTIDIAAAHCELCVIDSSQVIWANARCRVIQVDDPGFPGYCRVIWQEHVVENTDLAIEDRDFLMQVLFEVESAVRQIAQADKINLASFGNVVPHLHWHIIPRWRDDSHFPQPVWGAQQRSGTPRSIDKVALAQNICKRLERLK